MPTIKEIIEAFFNEIKTVIKEYVREEEAALKKRLKKLLITSIIISILVSLVISFIGSASLFILIGSLKYLMTSMPRGKLGTSQASPQASLAGCSFWCSSSS